MLCFVQPKGQILKSIKSTLIYDKENVLSDIHTKCKSSIWYDVLLQIKGLHTHTGFSVTVADETCSGCSCAKLHRDLYKATKVQVLILVTDLWF